MVREGGERGRDVIDIFVRSSELLHNSNVCDCLTEVVEPFESHPRSTLVGILQPFDIFEDFATSRSPLVGSHLLLPLVSKQH